MDTEGRRRDIAAVLRVSISSNSRQFIKSAYPALKADNPDVKILVREAQGVTPRAFVRFGEWEGGSGTEMWMDKATPTRLYP